MRLKSVDIHIKKFGREIEKFISNTDIRYWISLIEKVNAVSGIFYRNNYLLKRNPFIEGISQYLQLSKAGKSIWKHRSHEIDYLVQKAFIINRILHNLNNEAKKQIQGRLRSDDIRSFIHEITIATHFLRNGFDVEFVEYEKSVSSKRTVDFIVSNDSIKAEVECKWKSYDAGRKITRNGLYLLLDELFKRLKEYNERLVLEIKCSKYLGKNHKTFTEIGELIVSAIDKRNKKVSLDDDFTIDIHYLPEDTVIDSDEKFSSIIKSFYTPSSHFATFSNDQMTLIVKVESEKKDTVLKALYDEIKKSLDQFSKKRPAIIACYLEGIYPEQWDELKGETGLARMTTHLLNKENAKHILTIGYSSELEVNRKGNISDYSYPGLYFNNENSNYYKGKDIFCLKTIQ